MAEEKRVLQYEDQARELFRDTAAWNGDEEGGLLRVLANGMSFYLRFSDPGYQPILTWPNEFPPVYGDTRKTQEEAKNAAWSFFKGVLLLKTLGDKPPPVGVDMG